MIIFLRDEMQDNHATTPCCAIQTCHAEVFPNRIEIIYPHDGDITYIDVLPESGDINFRWGEIYEYCTMYDDDSEDMLREEFPNCKWFTDIDKRADDYYDKEIL